MSIDECVLCEHLSQVASLNKPGWATWSCKLYYKVQREGTYDEHIATYFTIAWLGSEPCMLRYERVYTHFIDTINRNINIGVKRGRATQ